MTAHAIAWFFSGLFILLPPPPLIEIDDVDVAAVADLVLAVDPEDLVDGLNRRLQASDIPEGFLLHRVAKTP